MLVLGSALIRAGRSREWLVQVHSKCHERTAHTGSHRFRMIAGIGHVARAICAAVNWASAETRPAE
eukprot:24554-Alexandrium_andersonii.AAC.1